MTFTAASLADGTLPSSLGVLYTAPAATVVIVKEMRLYADTATPQVGTIYFKRSGSTSRKAVSFSLTQGQSYSVFTNGETHTMSTGDTIEGLTTTASVVNHFIAGATE